jgi:hypothetical protein
MPLSNGHYLATISKNWGSNMTKQTEESPRPWRIAGSSRLNERWTYWAQDAKGNPVAMTYRMEDLRAIVERANASVKPCDVGLFSEDAKQIDLADLL